MTAHAAVVATRPTGGGGARAALRTATSADAPAIHALVSAHLSEGRLLPRTLEEISARAPRFLVVERNRRLVGCAELAPLGPRTAEVRSLVVATDARDEGLGRQLVHRLRRRAQRDGFARLCAFTHEPGCFVRMGFSLVSHGSVPEKAATDCHSCTLFRSCGQHAVMIAIAPRG